MHHAIELLESGKSYYLTNDVVAPTEGFYLEATAVNLRLDGHTISSSDKAFTVYRAGTTLTIMNGTISGNTTGGTIQVTSGGKLVIGENVTIRDKAIEQIIENYTRESGVRELKKKIGKILSQIATINTGYTDEKIAEILENIKNELAEIV